MGKPSTLATFAVTAALVGASGTAYLSARQDAAAATRAALVTTRTVEVPASSRLAIRLASTVSSKTSRVEQPVSGTVVVPIVVEGRTVIPVGSVVHGVVTAVRPSGDVSGRAMVSMHFTSLTVADVRYPIDARYTQVAPATKASDAKKIGIPAAAGAVVGAAVGGQKGAAIGAGVGGGAGTAVVLTTPGKQVVLSRGVVLHVRAGRPLVVQVRD